MEQKIKRDIIELSPETLCSLQEKELEGLLYFKEFCEENGLLFYFCGGCCIGTLRNKGFIPWDDDIDVFMPRSDYEMLTKLWKKKSKNPRFVLLRNSDDQFTGNIFTTMVDTKYTFVKENIAHLPIPHGIPIDIFPLDGCPKGMKRRLQVFWAMIYCLFGAQVVPEKHGGIVSFGSKILLSLVKSKKMRTKIWQFCEKQMSKYPIDECEYITEICAGPQYMMNEYPKHIFKSAVYKTFEGYEMPIPVGYDEYLKIAFGDYMELPPEEKRKPHHDIVELDLS
ncbi:MAG: LicD family protein [Bacillota bacterium]|nr:LicD family protein [Bacillota bacterium]